MELCISIIIGIILIIIVFILLFTVFRVKNPNEYIPMKTEGGMEGNVKRDNNGVEEYLNTSIEAYATIIGNDTLMFKLGYWGEKDGECWQFMGNNMNGGFDEFGSHKRNTKKFEKKYSLGNLNWEHACLYSTFADSFQSIRNSGLALEGQKTSAYLAGELEILGHYSALCVLNELSGGNLIIMSDNNITLVEDYSDGKSYYDLLNNDLDSTKTSPKGRTVAKYGKAKRVSDIQALSDFAVICEFYVCKINPDGFDLKQIIFEILTTTIKNFNTLHTDGADSLKFNGNVVFNDIREYKSRDEDEEFYDVISKYVIREVKPNIKQYFPPHFYMSSIKTINTSRNNFVPFDKFIEFVDGYDKDNFDKNTSIMDYKIYDPASGEVSIETFKDIYPFIGNFTLPNTNNAVINFKFQSIITTLVNYINNTTDIVITTNSEGVNIISDEVINIRSICLYCIYRLGYILLFLSMNNKIQLNDYDTKIDIPSDNPEELYGYCQTENYSFIFIYYYIIDIIKNTTIKVNLQNIYDLLCERYIDNFNEDSSKNEISKLYNNLITYFNNIDEFCNICGSIGIDDLDTDTLITIPFQILSTKDESEEFDFLAFIKFLEMPCVLIKMFKKFNSFEETIDNQDIGLTQLYLLMIVIYYNIIEKCSGGEIDKLGYMMNIDNIINLFDAEIDYIVGFADNIPFIENINIGILGKCMEDITDNSSINIGSLSSDAFNDFVYNITEYITDIISIRDEETETLNENYDVFMEALLTKLTEYIRNFQIGGSNNEGYKFNMDNMIRSTYAFINYCKFASSDAFRAMEESQLLTDEMIIPNLPIISDVVARFIILLSRYLNVVQNIKDEAKRPMLYTLNVFTPFVESETPKNQNDLNSTFGYLVNILERYEENQNREQPIDQYELIEYFNNGEIPLENKEKVLKIINSFLITCYKDDFAFEYFTNAIRIIFGETNNLENLNIINEVYYYIVTIVIQKFNKIDSSQAKLILSKPEDFGILCALIPQLSIGGNEVSDYIDEVLETYAQSAQ